MMIIAGDKDASYCGKYCFVQSRDSIVRKTVFQGCGKQKNRYDVAIGFIKRKNETEKFADVFGPCKCLCKVQRQTVQVWRPMSDGLTGKQFYRTFSKFQLGAYHVLRFSTDNLSGFEVKTF